MVKLFLATAWRMLSPARFLGWVQDYVAMRRLPLRSTYDVVLDDPETGSHYGLFLPQEFLEQHKDLPCYIDLSKPLPPEAQCLRRPDNDTPAADTPPRTAEVRVPGGS